MIRWLSLFPIILSVVLFACSTPTPAKPNNATPSPNSSARVNNGQQLPITANATVPNGTKIKLEVAQTQQQQMMGLMYRPALPDDQGMLFPFSPPQNIGFWMKNVPVALDMVFIRNGKILYIAPKVPPCADDPCPSYGPGKDFDQVIELRSGRAAELGLKAGDTVKIEYLNSGNLRR
jgi:uncharacterized protein